ncbi:hypothetical protein ANCCEY_03592 [Ancylostoma ceylanicum]|uniref:RRM domain-containing protein n=1 Tax=Ancylostoma ceylanicum TaxID=53326 RepID=A0A0D6LZ32_9BILA|nr:hypothetical protein ANCCEY_03592 [Ancylostoma ceylanicum]
MARVYLGRLPFRARESDIERFFQGYGRITDIAMKRGFAFIEFESKRDAEDAVDELNGRSILGDSKSISECWWKLLKVDHMAATCTAIDLVLVHVTADVEAVPVLEAEIADVAGAPGEGAVDRAVAVVLQRDVLAEDVIPVVQGAAAGLQIRNAVPDAVADRRSVTSVRQRARQKRRLAGAQHQRRREARVDLSRLQERSGQNLHQKGRAVALLRRTTKGTPHSAHHLRRLDVLAVLLEKVQIAAFLPAATSQEAPVQLPKRMAGANHRIMATVQGLAHAVVMVADRSAVAVEVLRRTENAEGHRVIAADLIAINGEDEVNDLTTISVPAPSSIVPWSNGVQSFNPQPPTITTVHSHELVFFAVR